MNVAVAKLVLLNKSSTIISAVNCDSGAIEFWYYSQFYESMTVRKMGLTLN